MNNTKTIKQKICLVDDKVYGIPQLINAIPNDIDYEFYYYDRIGEVEDINFDIVVLDFYLDKDNKTALDIIDKFLGKIIIGFSSVDSKNNLILDNGGIYKATKLKGTNINPQLEKVFKEIFS